MRHVRYPSRDRLHNAITDYCDHLVPMKGFAAGANNKVAWDRFIKGMRTSTSELVIASKGKNAKALQTAFLNLDGSCTACHNVFK